MIRLIAAVDNKLGIAKHKHIPWKLPAEQQYFQDMTMQHGGVVLMSRRVYGNGGQKLKGRHNFVLSSIMQHDTEDAVVVHNLQTFLASQSDVWVIGGESLYAQTIEKANELYITRLEGDFDCDQFFPSFTIDQFRLTSRSPAQYENGLTYYYEVYSRVE